MMLVPQFLEEHAAVTPHAPAIVEAARTVSYGELNLHANRVANLLRAAGLAHGDRVIIALENGADFVAVYLGTMKAGGVAVPLPAGPKSDRLEGAIADCTPKICVLDSATARAIRSANVGVAATVFVANTSGDQAGFLALDAALADCAEEAPAVRLVDVDLAAIIYTSGSTGTPRGVMLSHLNFVANARSIIQYLGLTSRDRVMCVLPFHYVYGLSLLHTHLAVGGSIVVENRSAFPNVVLDGMRRHEVTGFAGVPSTFAILLNRSAMAETELPSLRYVTQAGGPMPPARILEWLERGLRAPFYVMYGATEAGARLAYLPPSDLPRRAGSIGKPIPNVEILVIKDDGERAQAGETGELVARGSNIAAGYWNDPSETRKRFGPLGYRTGDLGYADEGGYLYLVGRRGDMLKVGAHRVGAREIEDVLHEHTAVHEAAVVGASDALLGEVPVAFVALKEPLLEPELALQAFCAARLPGYKVPARIVLCPDLPKLPSTGKIDKGALKALVLA
jgi:amino acid adenylation domain-containing protein